MIVKTVHKERDFTIVDNQCIHRDDLSARAKGLWIYLMSLPQDWTLHVEEVNTHFTEGRDAMRSAWQELEKAGYVTKKQIRDDGGHLTGWYVEAYEYLQSTESGFTDVGKSNHTKYSKKQSTEKNKNEPKTALVPTSLKDTLQRAIDESFTSVQQYENFGKERGQIRIIAGRCRRLNPDDPEAVAKQMLTTFAWLREHDGWWAGQPFIPSVLSSQWERIAVKAKEMNGQKDWMAEFLAQRQDA